MRHSPRSACSCRSSATPRRGRTTIEDIGYQAFWGITLPLTLWLLHYLGDVAGAALDGFKPAFTASASEAARLRYELTVAPARPVLVLTIATAAATALYYLADPVGSQIAGLSPLGLAMRYAAETFFGSIIIVLVFQSLRQLRAVGRIHAGATRVDLFRPAPLYAFSVLTSRTAIVIALVFIVPTLVAAQQGGLASGWWIWAPYVIIGIVVAAAVFAVPLRGMQKRILAEKRRLQAEVGQRIETTIAAIHRSVDAGEIAEAGKMNDALAALITERELVDKLPTLPWRPGTLGGLITAIALPLGLFVVTRLLERVV